MKRTYVLLVLLTTVAAPSFGQSVPALGLRGGVTDGPDDLYVGLQIELARIFDGGVLAPSLDVGIGDADVTVANVDVRWYLFRLPDTGLRFYGSAGPGIVLSPDTDLGFNLSLGLNVPMRGGRRYNIEMRFGVGDVPERKIGVAVLFPL